MCCRYFHSSGRGGTGLTRRLLGAEQVNGPRDTPMSDECHALCDADEVFGEDLTRASSYPRAGHASSVGDSNRGRYCVEYTPTPPLGKLAAHVAQPAGAAADEKGRYT